MKRGSFDTIDDEDTILGNILAWLFLLMLIGGLLFALLGCSPNPQPPGPPDPSNLSPPAVAAPESLKGQSFWTNVFGFPDIAGRWGGWLDLSYAIPVVLDLGFYNTWDGSHVLSGWVFFADTQLWYSITRGWNQGRFLWIVFPNGPNFFAVVAITDFGYRWTENCGLYVWDFRLQLWKFNSVCWFNR